MVELIKRIVTNVLAALYHPFGVALVVSVLVMFLYMFIKEYGLKAAVKRWIIEFRTSVIFRRIFVLAFYTTMILFRTLLNRNIWANPLYNVIGVWGLTNAQGELTTEVIENLILFIPFTVVLLWSFRDRIVGPKVRLGITLWKSVAIVFVFSVIIEFLQLFLRLGTFQLSDLFYNTLGGFVGGLIYWCAYKIKHRKDG